MDEHGEFWARPWINRRRTWRKLEAMTARKAVKEANAKEWVIKVGKFDELSKIYMEEDCPNKRLEPRHNGFVKEEQSRIVHLNNFFGRYPCDEIRLPLIPSYKNWRIKNIKKGTGERSVDKELVTLSNVLNYGVMSRIIEQNHVAFGRPKYRRSTDVKHCRESAPATADIIHKLARHFFKSRRSEVLGWQLLFTMFTGCRTSEMLRLMLDADSPAKPGFIQGNYLFLRRSKGGVNPFAVIGKEFSKMIRAFKKWHTLRFPDVHFYFPNHMGDCISRHALSNGLKRACEQLEINHVTPHGVRSFYVTKRRSDGINDVAIAGEIGDKTTLLMETTYGSRPPNWFGGGDLTWMPKNSLPAWDQWARV